MLREIKVTAGICRPWIQNKEFVSLPSVSCIKTASLSVADSDSALVATSWVASAVRSLPDFQNYATKSS